MIKKCLFLLITFNIAHASELPLQKTLDSGVRYILDTQVKSGNPPERFTGEWPSYMMNDHDATLLGKAGKKAWDSNCFTTASIYNTLADIYKKREYFTEIPATLERAMDNILIYENKGAFGFWPFLKRTANLYPPEMRDERPEVRRPNHYVLDNNFVNNASNIPEDADDTAVAYLALKKHNELAQSNPELTTRKLPNENFQNIFERYTDKNRKTIHYYNLFHGFNIKTGAYMTWLSDEKIFTPWSWLPIGNNTKDKPYIPYGANEVDCVVNTNVLNTLASYKKEPTKAYKKACKFVNKSIRKKNFAYCGLYYPNHYEIHYTTAKAIKAGVECLEPSRNRLVDHILSTQKDDGSFISAYKRDFRRKVIEKINKNNLLEKLNDKYWRKDYNPKDETEYDKSWLAELDPEDKIQSTAYAMAALVKIADKDDPQIKKSIEKGLAYLIRNSKENNSGHVYWAGGVFFAGGTLVRDDIRWRSDAYTTSIILELINEYLDE